MSQIMTPLEYAAPRAYVRLQRRYVWLLPLIWLPAGISACYHYGDEYGVYVVSNLPGLLLMVLLTEWWAGGNLLISLAGMISVVCINALLLCGIGWVFGRLRLGWRWMGLLPLVILGMIAWLWYSEGRIPARNPSSYHNWMMEYACAIISISMYIHVILAALLIGMVRLARLIRPRNNA